MKGQLVGYYVRACTCGERGFMQSRDVKPLGDDRNGFFEQTNGGETVRVHEGFEAMSPLVTVLSNQIKSSQVTTVVRS